MKMSAVDCSAPVALKNARGVVARRKQEGDYLVGYAAAADSNELFEIYQSPV